MALPERFEPLSQLARIAVFTMTLAMVLRFGLGRHWFSFYGPASVVLAALPLVALVVVSVHRRRGWRCWPVYVLVATTAAACLAQIGFWLTFFHGGGAGLGLGIGRSMLQGPITIIAAAIPSALAVIWLLLLGRISR